MRAALKLPDGAFVAIEDFQKLLLAFLGKVHAHNADNHNSVFEWVKYNLPVFMARAPGLLELFPQYKSLQKNQGLLVLSSLRGKWLMANQNR